MLAHDESRDRAKHRVSHSHEVFSRENRTNNQHGRDVCEFDGQFIKRYGKHNERVAPFYQSSSHSQRIHAESQAAMRRSALRFLSQRANAAHLAAITRVLLRRARRIHPVPALHAANHRFFQFHRQGLRAILSLVLRSRVCHRGNRARVADRRDSNASRAVRGFVAFPRR